MSTTQTTARLAERWFPHARGRSATNGNRFLMTWALLLIALSCAPPTGATAEADGDSSARVGIEAFIVETDGSYFRSSIDAVAAAASGDLSELFPAGSSGTLRQRLSAAESEGHVRILVSPVLAITTGSASVQSGLQLPVQTVNDNTVTVQYVNTTLRLDVTVAESEGGRLLLEVDVQKRYPSSLDGAELLSPPIQTTEYHFESEIDNGGTVAVTGVFERTSGSSERGHELALLLTVRRLD